MPQRFRWYIHNSSETRGSEVDDSREKLYYLSREQKFVEDTNGDIALMTDKEIADYLHEYSNHELDSVSYGKDVWLTVSDYLGEDANYEGSMNIGTEDKPMKKRTSMLMEV